MTQDLQPCVLLSTLAWVAMVQFVTSASFARVAWAVAGRETQSSNRGAARGFVLWWAGLGAYMALEGFVSLFGVLGAVTVPGYLATRILAVPLLIGATGGLVYYLVFIYAGTTRHLAPLAVFYTVVAGVFYAAVFRADPVLVVGPWLVRLADAGEGALYTAVYLAVGLPTILGALAYGALGLRVPDRARRFRATTVSFALVLWIATGLAANLGGSLGFQFFAVVVVGFVAATMVYVGFVPPAPVARWLSDS